MNLRSAFLARLNWRRRRRNQGPLTEAPIGLARPLAAIFGQQHKPFTRPIDVLDIGRERHRLRRHRDVDDHAREVFRRRRQVARRIENSSRTTNQRR